MQSIWLLFTDSHSLGSDNSGQLQQMALQVLSQAMEISRAAAGDANRAEGCFGRLTSTLPLAEK